jgi:DNA mismatch repair protein MutL
LLEKEKKLIILDQHALAERVIYERLIAKKTKISIQNLLLPENIALSPQEVSLAEHFQSIFQAMGFSYEIFPRGMLLQTIPDFVKKQDLQQLIPGIISDIQAGNHRSKMLEEVQNKIFAYMACRAAIKFGHKLTQLEMETLVREAEMSYSSTCPHGRPVIFEIGIDELKGKFDR